MDRKEKEKLVIAAINGDENVLYELMTLHKQQLYRMAISYLKSEDDALEAIQEVTYRAFIKIKRLKDPTFFQTWLIRILINYCHDEAKRKKRMFPKKDDLLVKGLDHSSEIGLDQATKIILREQLDELKVEYRDVIILKYFEDYTVEQISTILKKPEGTIKTWLRRALKELHIQLWEEDVYG